MWLPRLRALRSIFEVQLHEPDINPGTVASFDLLIPDTSGSLSVINTQGRLLGIEFRSADYEYAYVQTYNFEPYNGNLAIYRRTGASFTGDIEKMVGGIVSPVSSSSDHRSFGTSC